MQRERLATASRQERRARAVTLSLLVHAAVAMPFLTGFGAGGTMSGSGGGEEAGIPVTFVLASAPARGVEEAIDEAGAETAGAIDPEAEAADEAEAPPEAPPPQLAEAEPPPPPPVEPPPTLAEAEPPPTSEEPPPLAEAEPPPPPPPAPSEEKVAALPLPPPPPPPAPSEEREERATARPPPRSQANQAQADRATATRRAPPRRGSPEAPSSQASSSQAPSWQAASGAPQQVEAAAGGRAAGSALVPIVVTNPGFRQPPRPPRYPASAIARGLEGTVLIRALVAPDGSTVEIRIERSSGVTLLDRAALDAVRGWAFRPASVGGKTVPAWVEVPVRFRLG